MRQRKTHETHRGFAALLLSLCAIASTFAVALPAKAAADNAVYVPKAPGDQREAKTLQEAASLVDNGGTIYLTGDATADMAAFDGRAVTIVSVGPTAYTVTKSGSGENMLVLTGGANVTLQNVVIDASKNTNGRTVSATDGSTLNLNSGAVLENNKAYGAVYLDNSAIHVDGGKIRNNAAGGVAGKGTYDPSGTWKNTTTKYVFDADLAGKQGLGGAVLMANGSKLTMTGGEISGNTANAGGAVYAFKGSDIKLNGGTFSGNKAEATDGSLSATGGALCVDGEGSHTVTVGGAAFTENSANNGGAIYFGIEAKQVGLTVTEGTFSQNSAADGSVIYSLAADGVIDISGEETLFSENAASGNGGIYQGMYPGNKKSDRAEIHIHGGATFTKNRAKKGSCVYATRDGGIKTLTLDGAVFSNNTTTDDAGVMQYNVPDSVFTVKDCEFVNNRAENRGGCFYVSIDAKGANFTFDHSTFEGNYAKNQGGVWRGFPPNTNILFKNCTFDKNTAQNGDGGCFYCPGDGENSNVTIDGGTFTNNKSGSSGGAFRVNLNNGVVTVKGGAEFENNEADVNAGAFSIRRKGEGYYGKAYLLECNIHNNVCNADFSRYTEADLEPTKHYNTGGVYIGENITCYMYDALITGNHVESGFIGKTIGSGIGLCPNAALYLFPEHGATIYGNGDADTMDILAVPYDPVIHHETPAKLYVCDTTPDGQPYNWTDLDGNDARTGQYDWTNITKDIATVSALDVGSSGETNLDPVGFRANIGGSSGIRTAALDESETEYKVIIADNISRIAAYGGGGVMVNGTVIAGDLEVSIEKRVEGLPNDEAIKKTFNFTFSITERDSYDSEVTAKQRGFNGLVGEDGIDIGTDSGKVHFDKDAEETAPDSKYYYPRISYSFSLNGNDTIIFKEFKKDRQSIFYSPDPNDDDQKGTDYKFSLEETEKGGAAGTEITYIYLDEDNHEISGGLNSDNKPAKDVKTIQFTVINTFTELDLTKEVEGEDDKDKPWNFTLTLGGTDLSGSYPAELWQDGKKIDDAGRLSGAGLTVDGGVDGGKATLAVNAGRAEVHLKHGETLKIKGLPPESTYEIVENLDSDDNYTFTYDPDHDGLKGTIPEHGGTVDVRVTNKPKQGDLVVRKTVEGDGGDPQATFNFRVELTDEKGKKVDGEYGDMEFKDGVAEFTLKSGESKTATGLPADVEYTVTEVEANLNGYKTTETGAKGKIEEGMKATAEFVNSRGKPDVPQTGDKSRPGLWALLACAGALGALLLVRRMRREP